MYCPNCGTNCPDNVSFCPNCGAKLAARQPVFSQEPVVNQSFPNQPFADQPFPNQPVTAGVTNTDTANAPKKPKLSKNALIAIIAGIAVVVVALLTFTVIIPSISGGSKGKSKLVNSVDKLLYDTSSLKVNVYAREDGESEDLLSGWLVLGDSIEDSAAYIENGYTKAAFDGKSFYANGRTEGTLDDFAEDICYELDHEDDQDFKDLLYGIVKDKNVDKDTFEEIADDFLALLLDRFSGNDLSFEVAKSDLYKMICSTDDEAFSVKKSGSEYEFEIDTEKTIEYCVNWLAENEKYSLILEDMLEAENMDIEEFIDELCDEIGNDLSVISGSFTINRAGYLTSLKINMDDDWTLDINIVYNSTSINENDIEKAKERDYY